MSVISDRQEKMFAKFGDLQETVERLAEEPTSPAARVRNPFTAAARASALVRAERLLANEPAEPILSTSRVRDLHAKLFPPGYDLGGQLRDGTVWIGPQGGGPETAVFIPPEPGVVPSELEDLLSSWKRALPTHRMPVVERSTSEYLRALRAADAGDVSELTAYFARLPQAEN